MAILDIDILIEDIINDEMLGKEIFDLTADSQTHNDLLSHPCQLCRHATSSLASLVGVQGANAPDDLNHDPD
jgi:hypothetical protein